MSDDLRIKVTRRTDFGKGASRKDRREGFIPAVVYGHGAEPIHLRMPAQQTSLAVRNPNALLHVVGEDGQDHMVLPKDIQRHPLKQSVEHLDLIEVRRGEKVVVDVTVHIEGELAPGATYNLEEATVPVEAEATDLPEYVTISLEGREPGEHVYATDVQVPAGAALQLDDDHVIANVYEPIEQDLGEEPEAEATEGETAAAEAAEGETAEGESERDED